jgi:hypothetical protein
MSRKLPFAPFLGTAVTENVTTFAIDWSFALGRISLPQATKKG